MLRVAKCVLIGSYLLLMVLLLLNKVWFVELAIA